MAARTARNGSQDPTLATALATLLQNQAHFVAGLDDDRKRFARIETLLLKHDEILQHHDQSLIRLEQKMKDLETVLKDLPTLLKDLPEAIRKKIGFHKT